MSCIIEPVSSIFGAFVVSLKPFEDERGWFAEAWRNNQFMAQTGLPEPVWVQSNMSFNHQAGVVRGMHAQKPPHAEHKLVRCIAGAIFDVIVDIRPDSLSYGQWFGLELSQTNRKALLVPPGCAHGYQTLTENAEVHYQVSAYYAPKADCSIAYNDPNVGIQWPLPVTSLSPKDQHLPMLKEATL